MERNFYRDEFEEILKENADQFKMSPSKKVWHGIYNDIHPGTRWPSIAIGLLLVFTLVLVGHLNTQQSQHHGVTVAQTDITENNPAKKKNENVATARKPAVPAQKRILPDKAPIEGLQVSELPQEQKDNYASTENSIAVPVTARPEENDANRPAPVSATETGDVGTNSVVTATSGDLTPALPYANISLPGMSDKDLPVATAADAGEPIHVFPSITYAEPDAGNAIDKFGDGNESSGKPAGQADNTNSKSNSASLPRFKMRKNPKVSWTYYLGPSISYRTYSKQISYADQIYLGYVNNSIRGDMNRKVTHRPVLGFEVGTAMSYALAKKLKLTSGFQVNYSGYNIQANNIHPITATLVLHDTKTNLPYTTSYISYYGNGPSAIPITLHSYSVQVSIPVGFEYQLAGNNKVQFSAAANLQPSLVAASRSYILSTDKRNYIIDQSLSRPWNMSGGFGAYVSFASNTFKWRIGPQVRYQLLSSYQDNYQVKEHFVDYGIRLGISKIVK